MKIRLIILILFAYTIQRDPEEEQIFCHRELIESYDLTGRLLPRSEDIYLCPMIQSSCCSNYDQIKMLEKWIIDVKPKLNEQKQLYVRQMTELMELLIKVKRIDVQQLINKLKKNDKEKNEIFEKYVGAISTNMHMIAHNLLKKTNKMYKKVNQYRKSFYCYICDFENQQFFDIEHSEMVISDKSCVDLVNETLDFATLTQKHLYKELLNLLQVIQLFYKMSEAPEFPELHATIKTIDMCTDFKRSGKKKNAQKCYKYCSMINFNARVPLLEGSDTFINEALVILREYYKEYKDVLKEKPIDEDRILQEKKKSKNADEEKRKKLLANQESLLLSFDKADIGEIFDPFQEEEEETELNEFMKSEMQNREIEYNNKKLEGLENYVLNKMDNVDVEYNFEYSDENKIYKKSVETMISVQNFKVSVQMVGIDLKHHSKTNNFDHNIGKIINHMKTHAKYPIEYEKYDPEVLSLVNDVTDKYLQEFHRINYLDFHNMKAKIQKQQMLSNIEKTKELADRTGYSINVQNNFNYQFKINISKIQN